MRILLSNDDGIQATGLKVLERIANELSDDVWIVAPELDQSGASHSLTLRNPLRVREVSERKYALSGTPTDCVMYAVNQLLKDNPPDLVLSGVNYGSNLGEDVTYSGTVAAAMEACLFKINACSISLNVNYDHPAKWATVEHHLPAILRQIIETKIRNYVFININFPDLIATSIKGIKITRQGQRQFKGIMHERTDPRGKKYYWVGAINHQGSTEEGTDLDAIANGYISITPLSIDYTDQKTREELNNVFMYTESE